MTRTRPQLLDDCGDPYTPVVPPTGRQIICNECEGTEVTREDVLGNCRAFRIVEIRRRIIKLLHSELHWGLSRIGYYLHMDHSSVWHALRSPRRDFNALPQIYGRCKNTSPRAALAFKPAIPVAAVSPPPSNLTPEQLACRAATECLVVTLTGHRGFGGVREKRRTPGPSYQGISRWS